MITLKNIIESKYAYGQELYHYTSIIGLYDIYISDKLKGRSYFPKIIKSTSTLYTISFSRSKQWLYNDSILRDFNVNNECAIVFDATKLSNKYKLYPYSYFYEFSPYYEPYNKQKNHEYEERIILKKNTSLPNVKSYINGVLISKKMVMRHTDRYSAGELILKLNRRVPNSRYTTDGLTTMFNEKSIFNFLIDKIEDDLKIKVNVK